MAARGKVFLVFTLSGNSLARSADRLRAGLNQFVPRDVSSSFPLSRLLDVMIDGAISSFFTPVHQVAKKAFKSLIFSGELCQAKSGLCSEHLTFCSDGISQTHFSIRF